MQAPRKWIFLVPAAVLSPLVLALVVIKLVRIDWLRGDSAMYFQVLRNIAANGTPTSSLYRHIIAFTHSGLAKMTATGIASSTLIPPADGNSNILHLHSYFILFPLGLLAKIIPVDFLLAGVFVLTFVGLVYLVVVVLLKKSVPVTSIILLALIIMIHPAWSRSVLFGQFYPDRIFMLAGFLLMLLAAGTKQSRAALVGIAVLCASIDERGALSAGGALLLYVLLYWRAVHDKLFKLITAAMLLIFAELMFRFVIHNGAYGSFMPTNIYSLLIELSQPSFTNGIYTFLFVNLALLIIASFEWRAALIALVMMLPNILGNIGGAEKTGWSTHYPSFYFPILVWAATFGLTRAYQLASKVKLKWIFYTGVSAMLLLICVIRPYAVPPQLSLAELSRNFVPTLIAQSQNYISPAGIELYRSGELLSAAIPEGATVTTVEGGMPFLYHNRTLYFFPMDLDQADYAVLPVTRGKNGLVYGGIVSVLGPAEQQLINSVIAKRMRSDGYDLDHPNIISGLAIAVIKRNTH